MARIERVVRILFSERPGSEDYSGPWVSVKDNRFGLEDRGDNGRR